MLKQVIDAIGTALLIILLGVGLLILFLCMLCLLTLLLPFVFIGGLVELVMICIRSIKNIKKRNEN